MLGFLLGFNRLLTGPLDIQMHNTYFVLSTGYAVFPVFVFVATVVTVTRGIVVRFQPDRIKAVLALLGVVWVFLFFVVFLVRQSFH